MKVFILILLINGSQFTQLEDVGLTNIECATLGQQWMQWVNNNNRGPNSEYSFECLPKSTF